MCSSDLSRSLNEVLMRSINTSITAVLPVLSILVVGSLIFGATTLQEFGVALLVGLIIGVYSSIFIATPIAAYLNERQPTYRKVRERLAARGEIPLRPGRDLTGAGAGAGAGDLAAARTGTDKPDGDGGPGAAKSAAEPKGRPSVAGSASPKVPAAYSASHPPRPRKNKRR